MCNTCVHMFIVHVCVYIYIYTYIHTYICIYIYIYIYHVCIHIYIYTSFQGGYPEGRADLELDGAGIGDAGLRKGAGTVENPPRAQIVQFELFELIPLLKSDEQFSTDRFEPTVSRSTVPSPPLQASAASSMSSGGTPSQ